MYKKVAETNLVNILEKPDSMSWNTIHEVLWIAHKSNRDKGMVMRLPSLSGAELESFLKKDGHCFVAMLGDRVVGTCSFKKVRRNSWYAKDQDVAYCVLDALLPEYQGSGIYQQLVDYRESFIRKTGLGVLEMDTAEHNIAVQKSLFRDGFRYVGFKAYPYGKHYSVVMAKWLVEKPFSSYYCRLRFLLSKTKIKLRYKPGHVKRFGL